MNRVSYRLPKSYAEINKFLIPVQLLTEFWLCINSIPGLAPSSNSEKAQADMIVDGCVDLGTKIMMAYFEKDEAKKVSIQSQIIISTVFNLVCTCLQTV